MHLGFMRRITYIHTRNFLLLALALRTYRKDAARNRRPCKLLAIALYLFYPRVFKA